MEYKIIVNPAAGKGKAKAISDQVVGLLRERGVGFDIALTRSPGHAADLARSSAEEGWPVVVSLGGDGTVSEVIGGLVGTNSALGIIACGTGNDVARSLGVPTDVPGAVDVLLTGRRRGVDVGLERDQVFVNIAGVGFSCEVTIQANSMKRLKGSLAFLAATYKALSCLEAGHIRLELDDQVIETRAVSITVSNMKYAGGGMVFAPDAVFDDGLLDVCVVGEISSLSFALTFPQMYRATGPRHPALSRYRSRVVKVFTRKPMAKLFDGNVRGWTPLEAKALPMAVDVLVPVYT